MSSPAVLCVAVWAALGLALPHSTQPNPDELWVIVHPDNPLKSLDADELHAIFTASRRFWPDRSPVVPLKCSERPTPATRRPPPLGTRSAVSTPAGRLVAPSATRAGSAKPRARRISLSSSAAKPRRGRRSRWKRAWRPDRASCGCCLAPRAGR